MKGYKVKRNFRANMRKSGTGLSMASRLERLVDALVLRPHSLKPRRDLAQALIGVDLTNGGNDAARLDSIIQRMPTNYGLNIVVGKIYVRSGKFEEAREYIQQATRRARRPNVDHLYLMGLIEFYSDNLDHAEQLLVRCKQVEEYRVSANNILREIYMKTDDWAGVESCISSVSRRNGKLRTHEMVHGSKFLAIKNTTFSK